MLNQLERTELDALGRVFQRLRQRARSRVASELLESLAAISAYAGVSGVLRDDVLTDFCALVRGINGEQIRPRRAVGTDHSWLDTDMSGGNVVDGIEEVARHEINTGHYRQDRR